MYDAESKLADEAMDRYLDRLAAELAATADGEQTDQPREATTAR